MKLKVNFQDIITKINSNEIVDKLTLTNFEKQSVLESACLGRIKGNKALLDIVLNRGPVVYKEFIKVLRQNIPRLAFKIENTKGLHILTTSSIYVMLRNAPISILLISKINMQILIKNHEFGRSITSYRLMLLTVGLIFKGKNCTHIIVRYLMFEVLQLSTKTTYRIKVDIHN